MLTADDVLDLVPGSALSHESAARDQGLEVVDDGGRQSLTVPRNRSRVVLPGWDVHRRDVEVVEVRGRRVTSPVRTVVDLAGDRPLSRGVAVADSAVRLKLVTSAVLVAALVARPGPNRAARRAVAALVDPASGSVLESLFRVLVHETGLPPPRTQYDVRDGRRFVARVDFCWPAQRLVVEVDGFAFHSDRAAYRADRRRMNELERLGWRVLRFSWEDVVSGEAYVVATLRALLDAAAA